MCHLKRIIIDNRIQSHNDVLGDFKLCLWRIISMGNPYDNKFVKKKAECYMLLKYDLNSM